MHELYSRLDTLYSGSTGRDEILQRKEQILQEFQSTIREHYGEFFATDAFKGITKVKINNAYILSVHRYTGDLYRFYALYDALGHDLHRMVEVVLPVKKYKGDPEDFIKDRIAVAYPDGMS